MNDRPEVLKTSGRWILLITAVVLGCGGDGGASAEDDAVELAGDPASVSTAGEESVAASADPGAAAAAPTGQACEPEPATAMSSGWVRFAAGDGGFSFAHPAGWEKLDPIQVTGAFDSTSYTEAGLPSDSRTALQVVRSPAGFPNVVVYRLPGVRSPVDTLYARHERRFRALPQIVRIVRSGLERCIAGESARGMEFVFRQDVIDLETGEQSESDQTAYQQSWFAVRDGVLHHLQFLDADSSGVGTLDEVIRTWSWSAGAPGAEGAAAAEPGGEADAAAGAVAEATGANGGAAEGEAAAGATAGSGAAFDEARMASGVDASRDEPDPASFTTSFPPDAAIYVVYRLTEGEGGRVTSSWTRDGQVVHADDQGRSVPGERWAFEAVTPPPGGFPPGDYEVTLSIAGGESRTLPFTVRAPEAP